MVAAVEVWIISLADFVVVFLVQRPPSDSLSQSFLIDGLCLFPWCWRVGEVVTIRRRLARKIKSFLDGWRTSGTIDVSARSKGLVPGTPSTW